MKIQHTINVDHWKKLLEHLRYSGSKLLSYYQTNFGDFKGISAKCEFQGTKKGFVSAVRRAKSFSNVRVYLNGEEMMEG